MFKQVVRVWDLPTRVFHWLWVCSFTVAFITHDADRYLHIHVFAGYVFLALLLFRLCWGFCGSHHARFQHFSYSPARLWRYLRRLPSLTREHYVGHNPAGAWAVFTLLGLGFLIALTGLFTLGLEEGHGPLFFWFDPQQGEVWHEWHECVSWLMLGLVAVHLLGVLFESLLHRENLPRAMITGHKQVTSTPPTVAKHGYLALGMGWVLLLGLGGYFQGYAFDAAYRPFVGPTLADNALWREECGSCHTAYHPVLLPAASWQALLQQQETHFGEDLVLDEDTIAALETFHVNHAAETLRTEAAYKILHSILPHTLPLRITETPYWRDKHADIADALWRSEKVRSQANCGACHKDAQQGTYEDGAMHLPAL